MFYPNAIANAIAESNTLTPSTLNESFGPKFTEPLIKIDWDTINEVPEVFSVPTINVSLTVKLPNSATSTSMSPLKLPVKEPVNEPLKSAYADGAWLIEPEKLGESILISLYIHSL